jgi:hypothetical protein
MGRGGEFGGSLEGLSTTARGSAGKLAPLNPVACGDLPTSPIQVNAKYDFGCDGGQCEAATQLDRPLTLGESRVLRSEPFETTARQLGSMYRAFPKLRSPFFPAHSEYSPCN